MNAFLLHRLPCAFAAIVMAAVACLLSAGCMTAAEIRAKRIEQHFDLYSQLPQETQLRVSAGTIAIGDPEAAVWLAFGAPNKTSSNTTADGTTTVWQYTRQVTEASEVLVNTPPPPPPPPGARMPPPLYIGPHYETVYHTVEVLYMQIAMSNGLVTQIQTFN